MAHIEKSIVIDAPVERIFEYATTVARFTEWWSSLVDVRNCAKERMSPGLTYEWTYKMLGMNLDGKAEVLAVEPNKRLHWKNEGGIPSTFTATFADAGGGKTKYTITCDYTVPGSVLGKVADKLFIERFNEREAEHTIANLKTICEAAAKGAAAK